MLDRLFHFSENTTSIRTEVIAGITTFMKLNLVDLFTHADFIIVVLILFFMAVFNTVSTLVGVGERVGLIRDG